jgi:hypothetical protein
MNMTSTHAGVLLFVWMAAGATAMEDERKDWVTLLFVVPE